MSEYVRPTSTPDEVESIDLPSDASLLTGGASAIAAARSGKE
jgi:hypothetical protein